MVEASGLGKALLKISGVGCLFIGPEAAGSTEAVAGLSEGFTNVLTSSLPVTSDME